MQTTLKLFISVLILFSLDVVNGQPNVEWRYTLDNGTGTDFPQSKEILLDENNDVYVCWMSETPGNPNNLGQVITKISNSGTILWSHRIDTMGTRGYQPYFMKRYKNILYTCGYVDTDSGQAYLMATDTNATFLWQRIITYPTKTGDDFHPTSIATCADGGIVMGGYAFIDGDSGQDFVSCKFDSIGNNLWFFRYNYSMPWPGDDISDIIYVDSSGKIYIGGYSRNMTGWGNDWVVLTLDQNGNLIHTTRNNSGNSRDNIYDIKEDSSHDIWVCGTNDHTSLLTAIIDSNGQISSQNTIGGQYANTGYSLAFDPVGNCYVSGETVLTDSTNPGFLSAKFTSSNNLIWKKYHDLGTVNYPTMGGAVENCISSNNNFYALGYMIDTLSFRRFVVTKLDSGGSVNWDYIDPCWVVYQIPLKLGNCSVFFQDNIYYSFTGYDSAWNNMVVVAKLGNMSVAVPHEKHLESFSIYPNPARNSFTIKLNKEMNNAHLEIFNAIGEKIYSDIFSGSMITFDKKFSDGIYFVRITYELEYLAGKITVRN